MATRTELNYALNRAEDMAIEQAQEAGRLRALCERYREQVVSEARENERRNGYLHQIVTEENERLEAALADARAKVEELEQEVEDRDALARQLSAEKSRTTITTRNPIQFGPAHTGDCDCFSCPIQFDPTPKGYPDLYA